MIGICVGAGGGVLTAASRVAAVETFWITGSEA